MMGLLIILFATPVLLYSQDFGIGIIIGNPTGFTGKIGLSSRSAVAMNIGWSLTDNPLLHITGNYQSLFPAVIRWQDETTGKTREIEDLTPHLGIGGRLRFKEDWPKDGELNIGLRIGGGLEYSISRFGIFLEIYPVVDVLPSTDFVLEAGLGLRFYF